MFQSQEHQLVLHFQRSECIDGGCSLKGNEEDGAFVECVVEGKTLNQNGK